MQARPRRYRQEHENSLLPSTPCRAKSKRRVNRDWCDGAPCARFGSGPPLVNSKNNTVINNTHMETSVEMSPCGEPVVMIRHDGTEEGCDPKSSDRYVLIHSFFRSRHPSSRPPIHAKLVTGMGDFGPE